MKIFNTEQIRSIDKYTIDNEPISSIDLMERAALECVSWLKKRYTPQSVFKIFAGHGNNGGDGLAIGRLLADDSFDVTIYIIHISDSSSNDFNINYERIKVRNNVRIVKILSECELPVPDKDDIIIDAVFGSGLSRVVEGFAAKVIHFMNNSGNKIISIDIPSGLFAEDNRTNIMNNIVRADYVLSFQFPKLVFMFAGFSEFVKNFEVLPIGLHNGIIESLESDYHYITINDIRKIIHKRKKFSHKGNYGHGLLISGSYGKMGAAVLASRSCLKTGIGLLTCHVPRAGYEIMQVSSPETMVSIDEGELFFTGIKDINQYNAIGIGPGIGTHKLTFEGLDKLIFPSLARFVIDADAINIIGQHKELLNKLSPESILTPHSKEFERIAGSSNNDYERLLLLVHFAKRYGIYVVLKGAHSAIACPDGKCYFNSTGNPGMATAGSGDVLTGIILSLLAQGYNSEEAAVSGVFLHGLAGDFARERSGEESLIASDIIDNISNAYKYIKE